MIAGIINTNPEKQVTVDQIYSLFEKKNGVQVLNNKNVAFGIAPTGVNTIDDDSDLWQNVQGTQSVVFLGNIFNKNELTSAIKVNKEYQSSASLVSDYYSNKKEQCFKDINGNFVLAIWNSDLQQFTLVRDHIGIEPLYYYWTGEKLIFSSSLKALLRYSDIKTEINYHSLYVYLLFNYNPGFETIISGVKKLRPGHYLQLDKGNLKINRFWHLSFGHDNIKNEQQYIEELFSLMKKAVELRLENKLNNHGAFLSGGMDSSSVVALMSSLAKGSIHTFSFRCQGKSFDESHYAEIVSKRYQTQHHLVEFSPEEIFTIIDIVQHMDEPFCDIGIEIASYILGRAAEGKTDYILSGDGGDELFAGHPVYQADKIAQKFEKLPQPLQKLITSIVKFFPDTEKKKSFAVKAKRFAYSLNFPRTLYSNRWRIYYTDQELTKLCQSDLIREFKKYNPLDNIVSIYREANGNDFLSKTLYGDYHTVVSFYLRRMQVLRAFGIEGRFPMFDPRLVEYAATIPSSLKLNGSETKYILHKTMAGVLPDEIVFRKDKLGHSVPMKNWLRDVSSVRNFISDILSEDIVKKRGYFNSFYIQKLLNEHLKKKQNYSHRLWSLVVLELWLQKHIDR